MFLTILILILWSFIYLLISLAIIGTIAYIGWLLIKMTLNHYINILYHVKFFCCMGIILILIKASIIGVSNIDKMINIQSKTIINVVK